MKNFAFSFPTRVIFGRGAEAYAGAFSAPFGPNVVLLCGSDRIRHSGLLSRLTADLKAHGLTVTLFDGIQENPVLSTAEEGRRLTKEKKITLLLAVSGDNTIDTAKAINLGAKDSVPLRGLYNDKARARRALPIGVMPATAVTTSETSEISVLCHDVLHEKAALNEPLTRPRFALMDPVLTYTLPPRQTAPCVVDIFSHVFRRYFHKGQQGTFRSQMCAVVIRTMITRLSWALAHFSSYDTHNRLMRVFTVAHSDMLGFEGDFVCHTLSYVFATGLSLPHGAALSVLMTAWYKCMLADEIEAIADSYTLVWQVPSCPSQIQTAQNGISASQDFPYSSGLPVTLREASLCDVSIEHLAWLILLDMARTLDGNFRALDYGVVASLLQLARG